MKKQIANYQVSLKAILKNSAWETLILKEPEESYATYWKYDFPGWRIDTDEFEVHYLDILRREIKEELWEKIKVELSKKPVAIWRHKSSHNIVFYVVFEWNILNEDIEISFEHNDFEFVKLEEIILEDYFKSWMLEVAKMYLWK